MAQRKTVIIIGASGYVGYGISLAFSRAGYKTYGTIRKDKYKPYLALQEVIPVVGNFENTEWVDTLSPIDVIVDVTEDIANPDKHDDNLFALVTKIANRQNKKPLFIFTSGIKIYGDTGRENEPDFHSVNEESPYNSLDLAAHRIKLVERCEASPDFYTATVIPAMIYGRAQSGYGMFIEQAASGDKIVVHGVPTTVWHGVHIDDLGDVYVRLGCLGEHAHKRKYNVANDKYEKLEDIVKAVSEQFGGKHNIVYIGPTDGIALIESTSAWINSDKVRKELGWTPKKANFIESVEQNVLAWKAAKKDKCARTMSPIRDHVEFD